MSEISEKEKKIWEKYIIGKIKIKKFYGDITLHWGVNFFQNGSPIYFLFEHWYDEYGLDCNSCDNFKRVEGRWILYENFSPGNIDFGNDFRYPNLKELVSHDIQIFNKLFWKIKKKLRFIDNFYLNSPFLPRELVAHIFSFLRICEMEKFLEKLKS